MDQRKFIYFFCICLFIFHPLFAEEETTDSEIAGEGRKVCVFDIPRIQNKDTGAEGEIFAEILKNTLIFELKIAGFEIIDDSIWKNLKDEDGYRDKDLLEGSNAIALAHRANADVAINGFFTVENKRILFGIKCYDVKSRRLAVSILKDGRAGVSATSLINSAIEEIIPKISEELAAYSATGDTIEQEKIIYEDITFKEMIELGTKIKVTLKSDDEEADIYLADKNVGKIVNGEISFESKALSKVLIRIEKPLHHTESYEFELGEDDEVIVLPRLGKVSRLALETQYTVFQTLGIGIGIRYYFNPDWFFISARCYPYLQAGYSVGSNSVLHIDNNITLGHYLFRSPSQFLRFGVFLGFGMINSIIFSSSEPVAFDFYWDILGGWVELNLKNFTVYFKSVGRYNHDILKKGLLESGWAKPIPAVLSIGVIWKW